MDVPRTFFLFNGKEQNVNEASPDIFDAWIWQYVEEITGVDTSVWEVFHRWGIINTAIQEGVFVLVGRPDGSQIVEEKASDERADSEEKASENTSEKSRQLA